MIFEPECSDDFINGAINTSWQWNANYNALWIDPAKSSQAGLRLRAIYSPSNRAISDIPNILMQKWPCPEYICRTYLDLSEMSIGDRAGVITFGTEYGSLEVKKVEEGYRLSFIKGIQKFEAIQVEEIIEENSVLVETGQFTDDKLVITQLVERVGFQDVSREEKHFPKERVVFSYAETGNSNTSDYAAGDFIAKPGRWVGAKNGFYIVASDKSSNGVLRIERVEYEALNSSNWI